MEEQIHIIATNNDFTQRIEINLNHEFGEDYDFINLNTSPSINWHKKDGITFSSGKFTQTFLTNIFMIEQILEAETKNEIKKHLAAKGFHNIVFDK